MIGARFLGAAVLVIAPVVASTEPSKPDYEVLNSALGQVLITGTDEEHGNDDVESWGTGFFTSKSGFLVTANHLYSSLPRGVKREHVKFFVIPHESPGVRLRATLVDWSRDHDYLVLFVDVSRHPVTSLKRRDPNIDLLPPGETVFTMGYPLQFGYAVGRGEVSARSLVLPQPLPRYLLNLPLAKGQSGSPVFTADGNVVAVAIQSDGAFQMLTTATHANIIPNNWFAQSMVAPTIEDVERAPIISGVATVVPRNEQRTHVVREQSDGCRDEVVERAYSAQPGWEILPSSVEFKPTLQVGAIDTAITASDSKGVRLKVTLRQSQHCQLMPVDMVVLDAVSVRPMLHGKLLYTETPKPGFTQVEEIVRARVFSNGELTLPIEQLGEIQWSVDQYHSDLKLPMVTVKKLELDNGMRAYEIRNKVL